MDLFASLDTILTPFFTGLLTAAGVGLIIGLEREFNTHDEPAHIGGIRTFILTAMLGYCAGWMGQSGLDAALIVVLAGFFGVVAVAYYVQTLHHKMGLTTEIALMLTLLLGVAIASGYVRESLAVVVLMTLVLSLKDELHGFIQRITEDELFAFIKFIVLALLILPMLPDEPFGPENLLNLRDMGWIAVLVLSISFTGYLLLKFGKPHKGILLTALVGGLFSSTLVAWVFSARSRERPDMAAAFGSGIVTASSIMFVRVFLLSSIFSFPIALRLLPPLALMLLLSLIPAWRVLRARPDEPDAPQLAPGNPLDLKNALFFIILYVAVTYLMFGSRQWLDPALTYLSGAVAGIADIDAITISTAKWSAANADSQREAAIIILLAVMSNSVFKLLVSVFNGAASLRRPVLTGFGLVLLVGAVFLAVWMV
ncbi:MAG: MgtC/SapB family protein [Saprospiraceae bacterium]|nr:MgtC/SapB family protein [Saprospiraceae bacterium]